MKKYRQRSEFSGCQYPTGFLIFGKLERRKSLVRSLTWTEELQKTHCAVISPPLCSCDLAKMFHQESVRSWGNSWCCQAKYQILACFYPRFIFMKFHAVLRFMILRCTIWGSRINGFTVLRFSIYSVWFYSFTFQRFTIYRFSQPWIQIFTVLLIRSIRNLNTDGSTDLFHYGFRHWRILEWEICLNQLVSSSNSLADPACLLALPDSIP